jgi:hypothetical protein
VETLWFFAFIERIGFTRPNGPLYRDLLQLFVLQSRFTRPNDPLYRDLLYSAWTVRISPAQRSSTGRIMSAPADATLTTTRDTPMSR